MADSDWHDLGAIEALAARELQEIKVGRTSLAVSHRDGVFGVVSGVCNHVGGPLGKGRLDGDYLVCPWHAWKFHRATGRGEPGFESDCVPTYATKIEGGHLLVDLASASKRSKQPHAPHPLSRPVERAPGAARVVGISTTAMDLNHPRYSGSDHLLMTALDHAAARGHDTRLIRLAELSFRACEGYYSKSSRACTWPCSITQMDDADQLDRVYEAIVHWADVVLVATPIRWGAASSLYFRMAERLNCVQNQITTHNRVLIQNKVASFIVVGGQDNVQGVIGQMLGFFSELGFHIPQFPFIAHSRGWTAEDMEQNVAVIQRSTELHSAARDLVDRAIRLSDQLQTDPAPKQIDRGGRKAHHLTLLPESVALPDAATRSTKGTE